MIVKRGADMNLVRKKQRALAMVYMAVSILVLLVACAPRQASDDTLDALSDDALSVEELEPSITGESQTAVKLTMDDCLSCHPYDEVMEKSEGYQLASGISVNPHRTVDSTIEERENPHLVSENAKPVDCLRCHEQHVDNPTSASQVETPENIDICYALCHHQRDFTSCASCH